MPQTELFLKEPSEGQPRGGQRASAIIPIQGGFATKKCLLVWGSKTRECSHSSPAFLRAIHALVSHTLTAWPASIFRNEGEAQVKVRVFIIIPSPWLIPRGFTCQSRAADQSLVFPGPLELSVPEDKGGPWVVASRHLSLLISHHRLKFSRAFGWETILTHITSSGGRAQGGCLETKMESRLCHGSPGDSAHVPSLPGLGFPT